MSLQLSRNHCSTKICTNGIWRVGVADCCPCAKWLSGRGQPHSRSTPANGICLGPDLPIYFEADHAPCVARLLASLPHSQRHHVRCNPTSHGPAPRTHVRPEPASNAPSPPPMLQVPAPTACQAHLLGVCNLQHPRKGLSIRASAVPAGSAVYSHFAPAWYLLV